MVHIVNDALDTPVQVYLLSKDEKPIGVKNGSVCYEIDTKKIFMFDEENKEWIEQ